MPTCRSKAPSVRRYAHLKGLPRRSTKLPSLTLEYFFEGEDSETESEKVRVVKEPGKGKGLCTINRIKKDETVAMVIGVLVVVEKADHPLWGIMIEDALGTDPEFFPRFIHMLTFVGKEVGYDISLDSEMNIIGYEEI
uniref:Uncharacterized protein n=1 Tax=Chromera velia CCMP2878 TaxID=1169474 RepID=A0A0G4HL23_9ALVE|eukprot:Cvel_28811.t1-p1 / transcript=Cvel_28811.t1 / gene=Cvel_28811 / organism=Chromera_velia_CCMP2878 / gene_product=hypothetical protein / transcript_product=hypothetical protein / location=Cvel_scaffold3840:3309-4697(+) / protein_length=137 / sequence_SO=supercontig / SO=protein_coding / is_pseudo=false